MSPLENTSKHAAPVRQERGRWAKGVSPNPGGRPKVVAEVRDLARAHTKIAIETLVAICQRGENESARVAAANALLDRGWGKPAVPITSEVPTRITLNFGRDLRPPGEREKVIDGAAQRLLPSRGEE